MGILTLLSVLLLTATAQFNEPKSGEFFSAVLKAPESELVLTGADVRKVAGTIVYAIAHYGDAETAPDLTAPADWIDVSCGKAFVLLGTRKVPARGIRWSWSNSLQRVGYDGPNADSFVASFQAGFRKDSRLELIASAKGTLTAIQDGQEIGTWEDPALVRAVWAVSLGADSEVHEPERLSNRGHLLPQAQ